MNHKYEAFLYNKHVANFNHVSIVPVQLYFYIPDFIGVLDLVQCLVEQNLTTTFEMH